MRRITGAEGKPLEHIHKYNFPIIGQNQFFLTGEFNLKKNGKKKGILIQLEFDYHQVFSMLLTDVANEV